MPDTPIDSAAWYDRHSERYIAGTEAVDLTPLYDRFLNHLPARARILDAGCGSGRDGLALARRGHDVVAYDASLAMVRHASKALGQEVLRLRHEDIDFESEFDGVWSNASLLHVPRADLPAVFARLRRALVPGGTLYCSFKLGEGEVVRGERSFSNQSEASLRRLVDAVPGLALVETWISGDLRPGRESERWLNALSAALADEASGLWRM